MAMLFLRFLSKISCLVLMVSCKKGLNCRSIAPHPKVLLMAKSLKSVRHNLSCSSGANIGKTQLVVGFRPKASEENRKTSALEKNKVRDGKHRENDLNLY